MLASTGTSVLTITDTAGVSIVGPASGSDALTIPQGARINLQGQFGTVIYADAGGIHTTDNLSVAGLIYMGLGRIASSFAYNNNKYESALTDTEYTNNSFPAVHVFLDSAAQTTAGHKLLAVFNGSTVATEKFTIDLNGNVLAGGGNGAGNPVPMIHNAQTANPVAMEFGRTAATGGVLAVTFATAFGAAPSCVCVIEAAVPVACGITTAPSTTAVTFTAGAGTDVIDWHCTGLK